MVGQTLEARGWVRFDHDPKLMAWVNAALPLARDVLAQSAEPWRCGGTWFVGVEALDNMADGSVAGTQLQGRAADAVTGIFGPQRFHRAQLSTTRPGYPQPSPDESATAFQYRKNRDGAHIDGILPIGPDRRRMIREPHAFVLGIALNATDIGAAPLVIWDGSHKIMAQAFRDALGAHPPDHWSDIDVTDAYHAARAKVFATCARHVLHAQPGQAILLHRQLLHGVSPWASDAVGPPEGRIIAYFRPELPRVADWLGD